jgi:protein gp37
MRAALAVIGGRSAPLAGQRLFDRFRDPCMARHVASALRAGGVDGREGVAGEPKIAAVEAADRGRIRIGVRSVRVAPTWRHVEQSYAFCSRLVT